MGTPSMGMKFLAAIMPLAATHVSDIIWLIFLPDFRRETHPLPTKILAGF